MPDLNLKEEYKKLDQTCLNFIESSSGSDLINCHKNRYADVFPNESTRVVLKQIDGYGSDYINANIINKKYIMTQAPLPQTFHDFWRMIWEYEIPVVVMLTKLVENGKQKASQYWPNQGDSSKHGPLEIKNTKEFKSGEITVRFISITHFEESMKMELVQIHYEGWPDYGVPKSPNSIAYVLELIDRYSKEGQYIAFHCSAGLGRSGCMVAIHSATKCVEPKKADVFSIVNSIRKQRNGSVQSFDQYKFIHQVIN